MNMYHGLHTVKQEDNFIMSSSTLPSGKHRCTKGSRQAASTSPASASASDPETKSGSKNRRRIQLACTRCRKRKIRCSGETSDGAPCTNCQAANHRDCQFLRPETTQLLPALGSALQFPYHHHHPSMTNTNNNPLATSASSDSFGSRVHHHQIVPSALSPSSMYGMTYARSQSLSDLENYARVDSLQRESPYAVAVAAATNGGGAGLIEDIYNTPYGLHGASCIPATSTSDTMADYYGCLDGPKAWNNAAAAMMAADLARSQSAILYADVPTLFPATNLLSPGDMSTNRVLPMPTSSSGPSQMNIASSNNTPYLRDMDMVATPDLSFMPGGDEEASTPIYPTAARSSKSLSSISRASTSPATTAAERFSHAFAGGITPSHHAHHGQNYMLRYADGTLDTLPFTTASSAFARSGTTDSSSDVEEPLMMSISRERRQELQH